MAPTFCWQQPSRDPQLATCRYLLRRRDCWGPIQAAACQHPDVSPMVAALLAFATDGLVIIKEKVSEQAVPRAKPLLHWAFDLTWQF